MASYVAGNKIRLSVTYTDSTGAAIDPTTVALKYALQEQATTSQAYNPGNIVRDGTGLYHYDLDTTGMTGLLNYEWTSTGTGQAQVASRLTLTPAPL